MRNPAMTELSKLLRMNASRFQLHDVFSDFCEMAAICFSNRVDMQHFTAREARYMELFGKYNKVEQGRFPQMLALLVDVLECGMDDALGSLFMELELGNHWKGQYFTPWPVSQLMARITVGDPAETVRKHGYISVHEPAVGAGAMVIAMADAIMAAGCNYQQNMHVTAIDVSAVACHMAYVQFSLLHIPALIVHGNSLTLEEWDVWATPAHILGGWDFRLKREVPAEVSKPADVAMEADAEECTAVATPVAVEVSPRVQIVSRRLDSVQLDLF